MNILLALVTVLLCITLVVICIDKIHISVSIMSAVTFPGIKEFAGPIFDEGYKFAIAPRGKESTSTQFNIVAVDPSKKVLKVHNLVANYSAKPIYPPNDRTNRIGNTYHNAYKNYEHLQLALHVPEMSAALVAANESYKASMTKFVWENKKDLFPPAKSKLAQPLLLAAEKLVYATPIGQLKAPDSAPPDYSTQGMKFDIVGWGETVATATVVRSATSQNTSRVGWATFSPRAVLPTDCAVTRFYLVHKGKVVEQVPWVEDDSLNPNVPVRVDPDGKTMKRYIGPNDINAGSKILTVLFTPKKGDVVDATGMINNTMIAHAIYFERNKNTGKSHAVVAPPPEVVLDEVDTLDALREMYDESGTGVEEADTTAHEKVELTDLAEVKKRKRASVSKPKFSTKSTTLEAESDDDDDESDSDKSSVPSEQ